MQLTDNALTVLQKRYLLPGETPEAMFRRVATTLAAIDAQYGASEAQVAQTAAAFERLMTSLDFLPNSPTLANAGARTGQLSACFVLPVEDDLGGIFETIKHTALIHKTGGGTGFSFSRLRQDGATVGGTGGTSSGPLSFLEVFNAATESIKQGGMRRGANMGILRVDHPDLLAFVDRKADLSKLTNFNVSVAITDAFMAALEAGGSYDLIEPHTGRVVGQLEAQAVWRRIIERAWASGEPGVVFIDRMNQDCPVPWMGRYEATNPCWTGDTLVWTADGPRTFEALAAAGEDVPVLSQDDAGNLVFKMMRQPRMTRQEAELVAVTLDDGTVLRCTPDHNVFLKDGRKVKARELAPGDRLASVYRYRGTSAGYLRLSNGVEAPFEHHVAAAWAQGRRPSYPQEHCHHRNGIKADNRPENLEILPARVHNRLNMLGDANPMAGVWDERNPLYGRSVAGEDNPRFRADIADADLIRMRAEGLTFVAIAKHVGCSKYTVMKRLGWMRPGSREAVANHRVVSVEPLEVREAVYNGTVDDTHRYFVMCGANDAILSANCGEQPLLPYESCNLGSINLENFVVQAWTSPADPSAYRVSEGPKVDWERLAEVVHTATHLLDNVIDANVYPIPEIARVSKATRKIGLGVMGFARMLFKLGIGYGEPESVSLAQRLMSFIDYHSKLASEKLARERGAFPALLESPETFRAFGEVFGRWCDKRSYESDTNVRCDYPLMKLRVTDRIIEHASAGIRNSTTTTIAPTGTLSLIAGTSGGCEPAFGLAFKRWQADTNMFDVDPVFQAYAEQHGFWSPGLPAELDAHHGSLAELVAAREARGEAVSRQMRLAAEVFKVAHDVSPAEHVAIQAAFQAFNDSATSKTINFPHEATVEEVAAAYTLAWQTGCKGITVYRDGCRAFQPLSTTSTSAGSKTAEVLAVAPVAAADALCPEGCGPVVKAEGCETCPSCGWSACSVA